MRYRNFDLELYEYEERDGSESFSVRVTNSPAGDQSPSQAERVALPMALRRMHRDVVRHRLDFGKVIELGEALGGMSLAGEWQAEMVREPSLPQGG